MPNQTRLAAFIPVRSLWIFPRCSARSRGIPLRYAVWLAVLCTALAAPARAEEIAAPRTLFWVLRFAAPPVESLGASASAGERLTLDDAIALALDAYRLTKNPERLQRVREDVIQAYDAVLRAQRALEIREEALRMCHELDRVTVEQADRGEARARATSDVLTARQELDAWSRELNHLMGRDAQARLLATGEPGSPPAAAIRLGVTASGR